MGRHFGSIMVITIVYTFTVYFYTVLLERFYIIHNLIVYFVANAKYISLSLLLSCLMVCLRQV